MFKAIFQNMPEDQAQFRRVTFETTSEEEVRQFLAHYASTYDLPFDFESAFDSKIGNYHISGPGGFPNLELRKRISF